MKVFFINSVFRGNKQLLQGTFRTREEAESRIEEIKAMGMYVRDSKLEVEEFVEPVKN